jgi:hypothetical protein
VIRALLRPKYLWLATTNEVWVDGERVLVSGGPAVSDVGISYFRHAGRRVEFTLTTRTRKARSGGLDFDFFVDNKVVRTGVLRSSYVWFG